MRLAYKRWLKTEFSGEYASEAVGPAWLKERTGENLTVKMAAKRAAKKFVKQVKGYENAANVRAQMDAEERGGGIRRDHLRSVAAGRVSGA